MESIIILACFGSFIASSFLSFCVLLGIFLSIFHLYPIIITADPHYHTGIDLHLIQAGVEGAKRREGAGSSGEGDDGEWVEVEDEQEEEEENEEEQDDNEEVEEDKEEEDKNICDDDEAFSSSLSSSESIGPKSRLMNRASAGEDQTRSESETRDSISSKARK